jgi:hypothetical protein
MNLKRISAVFYKDAMWAIHNKKLLVLVLLPPLMSLLFHFVGKGIMLGFSQVFTFAMIGSLLGSYLVTEEKRIESLKNVLITPLTPTELAAGKFFLPLVLCLIFSFLTFLIAQKPFMFFEPSLLLGIVLMSAIVSLFGLIMGLIAKNEQELGVFAPIFILLFMMGTIQSKSGGITFAGYFPEFHLVHLIENYTVITNQQALLHLAFLGVEFLFTLLAATVYLYFYFSNDADSKRFSVKTILSFVPFLVLMAVSGLTVDLFRIGENTGNNTTRLKLEGKNLKVDLAYDQNLWNAQQLKSEVFKTLQFNATNDIKEFSFIISDLTPEKDTLEKRIALNEKDGVHYIIVEPYKDNSAFMRLVFASKLNYTTAYEQQCGTELLRVRFDNPLNATEYKKLNSSALDVLKNAKIECVVK